MDLKDQLKDLFPDHEPQENSQPASKSEELNIWMQDDPLICEYLTKVLKKEIGVGGSHKEEIIIIQGDYRDQIMKILKDIGFNVKRVGG
jgi:translation initiation factor 1